MTAEPWHRAAVGGLWDVIGPLQLAFLKEQGLRPRHRLLDVGCGSLRAGLHFIDYLNPGNYWGIDINPDLLEAGRIEVAQADLLDKRPHLHHIEHFEVDTLGETFQYALAHSVFTHLPLNDIIVCLIRVANLLKPGGRFYATFFEHPQGKGNLEPVYRDQDPQRPVRTFFDRDPFHYDVASLRWVSAGTGLRLRYIGEWGHPRGQHMLLFRKTRLARRSRRGTSGR